MAQVKKVNLHVFYLKVHLKNVKAHLFCIKFQVKNVKAEVFYLKVHPKKVKIEGLSVQREVKGMFYNDFLRKNSHLVVF